MKAVTSLTSLFGWFFFFKIYLYFFHLHYCNLKKNETGLSNIIKTNVLLDQIPKI